MARTNKIGIDYFPFDVDFFQDDKLQLIEAEFGVKGGYIAIRLLCKIYREGYYYQWGADECLLFAKNIGVEGVSKSVVDEVVKGLVKRGFFNESVFNSFGILTSSGIQARYFEITKRYKSVGVFSEYLLIDVAEFNNVTIIPINASINPINVNINPQRKRKENKEENIPPISPLVEVCDDEFSFDKIWELYDKRVGDKEKLRLRWDKLKKAEKQAVLEYIPRYKTSQPDKKYRKNLDTFLNNKSWNDEIIADKGNDKSQVTKAEPRNYDEEF